MSDIPVNINCDLGEGLDNEEVIMPLIDSCNIACGGHAGDRETMRKAISLAKKHGVAIGAHPSYPDRDNFGRVSLKLTPEELKEALKKQLSAFEEVLQAEDAALHHIKAHGALYNDLASDHDLVITYLDAINAYKNKIILYVPCDSVIGRQAEALGFTTAIEAFGDRNYTDDLKLVSRTHPDALLTGKQQVLKHIRAIRNGYVITLSGTKLPIKADTICIHSDTANATEILQYLREHINP